MAAVTGTFVVDSADGNREELSNVINRITPEDTPLYSMMSKGRCNSVFPEWEIDELADPVANAQLEGDSFSYSTVSPVSRVGNATQIFRKSFIVSKTQDSVSNAGSAEQTKYQTLKKGVELRKDIEFALLSNTATVKAGVDSSSVAQARKFGSLSTWLDTNTRRHTAGADGGYTSSTGVTAVYTAASARRAFTKDLIDEMMTLCYSAGANVKHMVMSPYAKTVFSDFMSDTDIAGLRTQVTSGQATLIGAADMYQSDFGMISVVPNRVMRGDPTAAAGTAVNLQREVAANVYFIDPKMLEFKWLRPIQKVTNLGIESDATPNVMIGEGTLCVKNEKGLGVVGDVFGTTSAL